MAEIKPSSGSIGKPNGGYKSGVIVSDFTSIFDFSFWSDVITSTRECSLVWWSGNYYF